jgi:Cft2 family RNA processing exonuclease
MRIAFEKGLALNGSLIVDPMVKSHNYNHAIVTHAHSDHVCLNKGSAFYCTPETQALLHLNFDGKKSVVKTLPWGKKVKFQDLNVSLHNAGHILGSSQALIQNAERVLITSDFKLQSSLIEAGAEILQADTLIIESTFGLPQYQFPLREQVYSEMATWCKQALSENNFIVLAGYALGKSQELTAFCNEYLGVSPIVHEKIFNNNKVYEKFGTKLGTYYKLDHNLQDSNILIMPPNLLNQNVLEAIQVSVKKRVVAAKASGWPYRNFFDQTFTLSDHADFNDLLAYVKQAEPKQVFTIHGQTKELAWHIRKKLGIPARPLAADKGQALLQEFH